MQCNACKGSYNGSQGNMFMEAPPATHSVCKGHNGSDNGAGQDPGGDRKEVLDNCFVLAPLFLLSTTLLLLLLLSVPPLNLCSLAFQPATYLVLSCFFYFYRSQGGSLPCLVTPSVTRCSCSILLKVLDFSKLLHGFVKIVTRISLSCHLNLLKLIHGFQLLHRFVVVTYIS